MVMIQRCYACLKSRVLVSAVSHGRVASKRLCCWFVFCFFFLKKKESVFGFQMLVFQHAAAGSDIGRTAALEIDERINSQIRDS